MNDDTVRLIHHAGFIAGRPPPTVRCLLSGSGVRENGVFPTVLIFNGSLAIPKESDTQRE